MFSVFSGTQFNATYIDNDLDNNDIEY